MRLLFAFYGGPDQIMGVTSALATIAGLALVFWNKMVAFFGKIMNKIHPPSAPKETVKDALPRDQSL